MTLVEEIFGQKIIKEYELPKGAVVIAPMNSLDEVMKINQQKMIQNMFPRYKKDKRGNLIPRKNGGFEIECLF